MYWFVMANNIEAGIAIAILELFKNFNFLITSFVCDPFLKNIFLPASTVSLKIWVKFALKTLSLDFRIILLSAPNNWIISS